jgi:F420-dependent oxidoreductase-like protein
VLRREEPVANSGKHYPLPYTGEGAWGLGKPLKSIVHPLRADLPIFLGAEGPKNVALAAEIADGWLPLYYSPFRNDVYRASLSNARPGFEISQGVVVNITNDLEKGLEPIKRMLALYVGGMGAKQRNFHKELVSRMGFEAEANRVQDLYLAGRKQDAAAAIPSQLADEISLVGPIGRIRERLAAWRETPVTSLLVSGRNATELRTVAEVVLGA